MLRSFPLLCILTFAFRSNAALTFSCAPSNDLYQLIANTKADVARFDVPVEAIDRAAEHSAVFLLADQYPNLRVDVPPPAWDRARQKHLRLYVEFPKDVPGLSLGEARTTTWERAIIANDAFAPSLLKLRILAPQDCHFLPTQWPDTDLVVGRVAGFDNAVFGLPKERWPLLIEMNDGQWIVATTKLSGFVTSRFAPTADWERLWLRVLSRMQTEPVDHLQPKWSIEQTVHSAYAQHDALPPTVECDTFERAAHFYQHARLLVAPERREEIHRRLTANIEEIDPPSTDIEGDGSMGMLEGYASRIRFDGSQPQRTPIRSDCNAEAAMVLSLSDDPARHISANLLDYVFGPEMEAMGRLDPKHPTYGLIAWGAISRAWMIASYGDDNARVMLSTMLASAALKTDQWDTPLLRGLLANLRTTGKLGFRGDRIDVGPLEQQGWRAYHDASPINPSPHFESYLWACYLWAYAHTGEKEFLDKAQSGIALTIEAYTKKQWRWMDNIERSRMLLPLAWLVRVEDTPIHRQWLTTVSNDLLHAQQPCGAIQERLGGTGGGHYQIPQSNEAYGTGETPLIQSPGDPVADQLYTTGFALLGLHEAAAATGDAKLKTAEDHLADFLCRIQVRSQKIPYLDGSWFRAFDYRRWDYWASSADLGWGVWSAEAGWGPAWTAATLALRRDHTSFWEMTASSKIKDRLPEVQKRMTENDGRPWNGS